MNLLKIEGLIIYLEKMIKEMKNIYDKFYKKNKNIFKNKIITILNKIPQNQNILLIKKFLIY